MDTHLSPRASSAHGKREFVRGAQLDSSPWHIPQHSPIPGRQAFGCASVRAKACAQTETHASNIPATTIKKRKIEKCTAPAA
jgi:hypothetical protein